METTTQGLFPVVWWMLASAIVSGLASAGLTCFIWKLVFFRKRDWSRVAFLAMEKAPVILDKIAGLFNILQDYVIMQGRIKPGIKRVEVEMRHTKGRSNDEPNSDSSSG